MGLERTVRSGRVTSRRRESMRTQEGEGPGLRSVQLVIPVQPPPPPRGRYYLTTSVPMASHLIPDKSHSAGHVWRSGGLHSPHPANRRRYDFRGKCGFDDKNRGSDNSKTEKELDRDAHRPHGPMKRVIWKQRNLEENREASLLGNAYRGGGRNNTSPFAAGRKD